MASTTSFLDLIVPLNGEYVDTWDQALNENLVKIDAWAEEIHTEIQDARFGQPDLKTFLEISHNNDGSLKPSEEVINSRSSFTYGDEDPSAIDFDLAARLHQGDKEVFDAREGYSDLRNALAARACKGNMVLDGAKDGNGYPTWMGFTGINVQIDGSVTPVIFMASGLLGRVRKLDQITISGSVGTKYLYFQHSADGVVVADGSAGANGSIGSDGSKIRLLEDTNIDFVASGVQPGDVLEILGTGVNAGVYQIRAVAPGGNANRVQIYGVFPGGAQASLNYTIKDPVAGVLGFEDAKLPVTGKLYMGEVDWDGSSVIAARPLHFEDYFIGDWRAVDVSGSPTFTESWNHRLFDDAIEVQIQVSQANDGSAFVETLSLAQLNNTIALNNTLSISNTLSLSAGDQTLSGAVALAGALSLDGTALMARSAKAKWTNSVITVSNVVNNLFYKDYNNIDQTAGFVRVVIKKLRK
jgi:hypothetical protein